MSHIFYIMCTVIYNYSHSGLLVFATDAELYKNLINIVYNYDTLNMHMYQLVIFYFYHT